MEEKCILDVSDSNALAIDEDADDIEPICLLPPPVTCDPDPRRPTQLLLLLPVDCANRITEGVALPCFHFHERHEPFLLDHEIDVAVPRTKTALDNAPPLPPKPPFRDALPELPQCLPGR